MNIGVFCASSDRIQEIYTADAVKLGGEIAARGWSLVYGGTDCGLMRKVADTTISGGGKALGIIPECIRMRGVEARRVTELLLAPDMKERKRMMREHSDAFVALPGGWGTLEEITEVITLRQLECHHKPIVFVNTEGFYDKFFDFIRDIHERGFVSSAYDRLYYVAEDVDDALRYIENYVPETTGSKYQEAILPSGKGC